MSAVALEGAVDRWDPRQDRQIYLAWVGLNWLGMIAGFGYDAPRYLAEKPAPPPLIHIHAAVFVAWLVVQTAQVALIARGNFRLHARLGVWALGLAALMVPLGLATALTSKFRHLGLPHATPQFLAINLVDIIPFGVLTVAGYLLRRDPASHKRLMMLAMVAICDPGFSRASDLFMTEPASFWGLLVYTWWGNGLLIALMAGWDLLRRGALNRAFAIGASLLLASEVLATVLYQDAGWKLLAIRIVRAWGYGG